MTRRTRALLALATAPFVLLLYWTALRGALSMVVSESDAGGYSIALLVGCLFLAIPLWVDGRFD